MTANKANARDACNPSFYPIYNPLPLVIPQTHGKLDNFTFLGGLRQTRTRLHTHRDSSLKILK